MNVLSSPAVSSSIDFLAKNYQVFDDFSKSIASKLLITPGASSALSGFAHDTKVSSVSTMVKTALIVLGLMATWIVLSHPLLTLSAIAVGLVVNLEPKTQASITRWINLAQPLVIDPILENESPVEKTALAALGICIVCLASTTIVAPTLLGLAGGYKLRQYFSPSAQIAV